MQRSVRVVGIVCIALVALSILFAWPIVGPAPALRIGFPALTAGFLLGCGMAGITRFRNPTVIYLLLAACVLTAWPLRHPWPMITIYDYIRPDSVAKSEFRYNFLEMLRAGMYLIGMPFPYAYFGNHAADPVKSEDREVDSGEPAATDEGV